MSLDNLQEHLVRILMLTEEIIGKLSSKDIDALDELLKERERLLKNLSESEIEKDLSLREIFEEILVKDGEMRRCAAQVREELIEQISLTRRTRRAMFSYESESSPWPDAIFFDRKK